MCIRDRVCVLLASKLSGTFQSAQLAKELSGYDEIYIVDSQQALCGLRMLVDFALSLIHIYLGYLTAVCALKRVLSVRDMKVLISAGEKREKPPEELYAYFLQALDRALNETAQSLPPQAAPEDLPRLALDLALRSYASQLACARILDILQPPCEEAPKKAKK